MAEKPHTEGQKTVLDGLHRTYDMRRHTRTDSDHAALLTPEFIDEFSIVGPPQHCIKRLEAVARLGIDKVIAIGATGGADRVEAGRAAELLAKEVLPAFSA